MNHNEIVGWENNQGLSHQLLVNWLKDQNDQPLTNIRQGATQQIIGDLSEQQGVVVVERHATVERYPHMLHFED